MLLTTTLWAQSVSYIDADGKSKSCTSYTVIDGSHTSYSAAGWYVVQGNVSTSLIEFTNNGDVHLILCDGATLTLSDHIDPYGSMTIYGQSGGTGTLRIGTEASPSTYTYGAIRTDNGTLTINGGKIYAYGNNYAIRSPYYASIIINGGTLTAKGPDAIVLDRGSATINGGTVNLSSTNHDAICTGGGINITGGTVNANGSRYGLFTTGGNISITGGKVTASGGNSYGALRLLNGSLTLGCSHQDDSYLLGNIYGNYCTVVLANNFKINGASSTYGKAGTYDDEYFNNNLQNKTLTPDGLCVAPSSVSVSNVTMTAATLSWTEKGTSTNWVLQYSTSNTFATATSVNVSNTPSKTITGLTAQTTYYCRVKAVNGNSESSWSSVVQFTTPDELNLAGQGTKDNPYLISSVNDWNKFATNVNNGVTYSDKYIKLTASISVSQMVGTSSANSFQGHFDGGDNTLTVSYGSSTAPIAEDNVAPFRYAGTTSNKTCEIKNLHVTGTIYTSKKYAAGFVGQSNSGGNLTFTNCRSSITINSSTNGDGTHGGFVGVCNSSYILEFNGCVFDGKLLGENTTCCGGFVGWRNAGTVRFYQSIFAPSQINVSTTGSATFCRNADSNTLFRRAYYTQTMNTEQGKLMHSITSATGITLSLSGSQNNYSVSGITNYGDTWTEHAGLKYGNTCYAGNGETVSLTLGTTRQGYIVSYSVNAGTLSSSGSIYNLAMPNADVTISANYSPDPNHFSANNAKTEYTIKTATGWGVFCDALQDNDTYNRFSGKTVKLDADISISTMAGSSNHDFCGTFDGQSHTLTFNYGSNDAYANEQYIAPFRYVVGVSEEVPATIKNLHIVGDIYTKQPYAAGLVAQMWGTVRITNCRISTAIHSSVSGDGSHGGLVSVQQNGGLEIEGCVFDGKLLGSSTSCCGGFVGWRKSGAEIRNSLFAPTEVTIDNANSATFSRNKIDTYNSYYTYLLNDGTNYPPYLNDGTTSPRKFNNGQQARKITAGNFVTLAFRGTTTQYNVSGITSSTVGLKYNNVFYAASGDQVSLSLSNTVPANYEVSGYSVSPAGATLTGSGNNYTLTMPDADVLISPLMAPVTYLDSNGTTQSCSSYHFLDGTETTLAAGWYVAKGNVSFNHQVTTSGDVHIILKDNAVMNIGTAQSPVSNYGIYGDGHSISIYAQSSGNNKGKLCTNSSVNGIYAYGGNIVISGGEIEVKGANNFAIYAYHCGKSNCGSISISNHATITAEGASAIYAQGGNLTAKDCTITATATNSKCSSLWSNNGSTTLTNCKVITTGGYAGIRAERNNIIINGGEIEAHATDYGIFASNYNNSGGSISITNHAIVIAEGGIGIDAQGGSLTVEDCTITATGTQFYATRSTGGNTTLTNCKITATGRYNGIHTEKNSNIIINGGEVEAYCTDLSSGQCYGGISSVYGYVSVTGATITAEGSSSVYANYDIVFDGSTANVSNTFLSLKGDIIIRNHSHVTSTINKWYSLDTESGSISISDSEVDAKATILSKGGLTLTNATVNVDYNAKDYAIYGVSSMTIDGSTVTTAGKILSERCDFSISNSKVDVTGNIYVNDGGKGYDLSIIDSEVKFTDLIYSYGNITIDGSIVKATGNDRGQIRTTYGNINLDWSNPSDLIYAKSYYSDYGALVIGKGKTFTDEDGNTYSGTITGTKDDCTINGKTLYPYIENLDLTANAVDDNYWTTFYCGHTGYKIDDEEKACAYTATCADNKLTLHKLGKVIPKNTAVILVGEDNDISMTASTDAAEYSVGNSLQGVDVRTEKSDIGSGTFYVLSKKNDDFGFFEYTGKYIPARKAYLLLDSQAAANGLTMVFDDEGETTAISDALRLNDKGQMTNDNFYDLQGRKIEKPTKGLYIHNGKKVVIK